MDAKNMKAMFIDLDRAILPLQLAAWRKLARDRKINNRADLSQNFNESRWAETVVQKNRLLIKKYPFMEISESVLSSYSFGAFKQLLDTSAEFEGENIFEKIKTLLSEVYDEYGGASNDSRQLHLSLARIEPWHKVFIGYFDHPELLTLDAMIRSNHITVVGANHKVVGLMSCLLEKDVKAYHDDDEEAWRFYCKETYQVAIADLTKSPDYYELVWSVFETIKANRKIVMVPNEFLRRNEYEDPILRMDFLVSDELESVITIPTSVLGTNRPPSSFVIFDRLKNHKDIFLVDLVGLLKSNQEFTRTPGVGAMGKALDELLTKRKSSRDTAIVSKNECRDNDYCISPSYYCKLRTESSAFAFLKSCKTKPLKEVADLVRMQSLKEHRLVGQGKKYYEVTLSDIGENGFIREPKNEFEMSGFFNLVLKSEDVLLSIKGAVGRVGYVEREPPNFWVPNQSLIILRIKTDSGLISPIVLYRFLSSSIGQAQINQFKSNERNQFFRMSDLRRLVIAIPSVENQIEIVERFREAHEIYRRIERLQQRASVICGNDYELFR